MPINRGKQFEKQLKEDWIKSIPDSSIDRICDSMSGYYSISNISDFIAYKYPNIYYLEAKSIEGNTFPLVNLTQYDKLVEKLGIPGVRVGVVIWFRSHDSILYVPISTIKKMKEDNKKSVNINTIDKDGYRYINIPTEVKRILPTGNYNVLLSMKDGD